MYNSVSYDKDKFLTLSKKKKTVILKLCNIDDNINHISSNHINTHDITVEYITNAVAHLKSEKKNNFETLSSEVFINGIHLLNVYGFSPWYHTVRTATACVLLSTINYPLIKNKIGNKSDSNNYRAIAINSLLSNLFDTVLLKIQHASIFTDSLHFGLKPIHLQ